MFTTIVWATDGSEAADRALPYAKALATGEGKKLVVVHNKELLLGPRVAGYTARVDEEEIEAKIHRQVEEVRAEGLDATFELVAGTAGHSAHIIADAARRVGADVIVVGTRGHAPITGLLLGSVTQRLLHIAHCPVLAVPAAPAGTERERTEEQGATVA